MSISGISTNLGRPEGPGHEGRNNFQFYDQGLSEQISYRSKVETQFQHALEQGEFQLVYQPKIDMATNKLKGFEALVRWQSPVLGVVFP